MWQVSMSTAFFRVRNCPDAGIDAIDFRRAIGIEEEPHDRILVSVDSFYDEKTVRAYRSLADSWANLVISSEFFTFRFIWDRQHEHPLYHSSTNPVEIPIHLAQRMYREEATPREIVDTILHASNLQVAQTLHERFDLCSDTGRFEAESWLCNLRQGDKLARHLRWASPQPLITAGQIVEECCVLLDMDQDAAK